jgi:hypothetical protein
MTESDEVSRCMFFVLGFRRNGGRQQELH